MARFFFYDEIISRTLTPVEDIQWLAGQIAALPAFIAGNAVLCGSVAWGKPSWRSDIDVVHFSTIDHPRVEEAVQDVIQQYLERTNNRFIAPRVDIITIGAESLPLIGKHTSVSAISIGKLMQEGEVSDVFVETAVLFADHIGSIAKLKGNPWQTFFDRYLSSVDSSQLNRRESIKSYVEKMTMEWVQQPLHQLNFGPDGQFTARQLDLISKTENYPVNLVRRIFGDLGYYPQPDKGADVLKAFSMLEEPWAKALNAQLEPFYHLNDKYEEIVAACKKDETPLSAIEYSEQVRSLFVNLPFLEIQRIIWEYLKR